MRDPKRIPVVLAAIRRYWERYPDLRLSQIVMNVAPAVSNPDYDTAASALTAIEAGHDAPGVMRRALRAIPADRPDPYYLEDDEFLRRLQALEEGRGDGLR